VAETPRLIFWETTKRCNLKCGYCRVLKSSASSELTTDEALKLVSDIKSLFPDTLLVLSGGEPLLREDLFSILSRTYSVGLNTSIATNGTLLTKREASRFRRLGVKRISISIGSNDEASHDASRGVPGSFKKVLQAASVLKTEGVPFQINFTVTKSNEHEIGSIAQLSHSLGAAALHYFVVVATGCGRELDEIELLDSQDMDETLRTIRRLSEVYTMDIRPTCAPQYVRFISKDQSNELLRRNPRHLQGSFVGEGGCLAGSKVFFISSEGDVYPCGYLPIKAGSVRRESVDSIWRNSPVFAALRENDLKGNCSACSLKERCKGCRARAYSATGDYMTSDPTCLRNEKLEAVAR
jgi:radical SAM protein with 4Fe4S-binding SPASM domain